MANNNEGGDQMALMAAITRRRNPRLDRLAGIDRPAFGKYECLDIDCRHKWVSWAAWRDYGQACERCYGQDPVEPFEVHAVHYFVCRPCHHLFRHNNMAQRFCPRCGLGVLTAGIRRPREFVRPVIPADAAQANEEEEPMPVPMMYTNNPHKMHLCQKCLLLNEGRPSDDWEPCNKTSYREIQRQLLQEPNAPVAAADN